MGNAESKIERPCTDLAEALLWASYKGAGHNGASDHVYLKAGRGFTVEFKTATGSRSPGQDHEVVYLKKRGVPHYLVRTLTQMRNVLLLEEAKFDKEDLATMEE